jgi:hypothetical protein
MEKLVMTESKEKFAAWAESRGVCPRRAFEEAFEAGWASAKMIPTFGTRVRVRIGATSEDGKVVGMAPMLEGGIQVLLDGKTFDGKDRHLFTNDWQIL